ncbi:MAG: hypothetical protein M0Z34_02760 [Nitrospiraceae bacterium]|nr:hypothetical protein [Nitrospiraceae bacterium]
MPKTIPRTSRAPALRVALAGIRWRAGASVALFLVATIAFAAAALGPLYLRSSKGAVLSGLLDKASPLTTQLDISPINLALAGQVHFAPTTAELQSLATRISRDGAGRWYGTPIFADTAGAELTLTHPRLFAQATILARTGQCAKLTFTAGRCPSAVNEIALSTRTAALMQVKVGSAFSTYVAQATPVRFRVVGEYRAPSTNAPYWQGVDYFGFGTTSAEGIYRLDAFVTDFATLQELPVNATANSATFMMKPRSLHYGDVATFETDYTRWKNLAAYHDGRNVSTRTTAVIGDLSSQSGVMSRSIAIVDFEVVALALVVLFSLVSLTSDARAAEVALGQLRGFRRMALLRAAALEPLAIVTLAVPVGLAVGWAAILLMYGPLFPAYLGAHPTLTALAAVVAVYIGSATAVGLGSLGLLSSRFHGSQGQSARARMRRNRLAVADGAGVVLAMAGFFELVNSGASSTGTTNILAALSPALLAIAAGIIGVRLLPLALALAQRFSRNSTRIALFLSSRSLARRSGQVRQVILVSLATAVAIFALQSWNAATNNRALQADFMVGAAHVLDVALPPNLTLEQAVSRADPSGKHAMAVVEVQAASGRVLAVQASRLAGIMDWPRSLDAGSAGAIAKALEPKGPGSPLVISGARALLLKIHAGLKSNSPVSLQVTLFNLTSQQEVIALSPPLAAGTHLYRLDLSGGCATSCDVQEVSVVNDNSVQGISGLSANFDITSATVQGDHGATEPFRGFLQAGNWTAGGGAAPQPGAGGALRLAVTVPAGVITTPALTAAYLSRSIPAVTTSDLASALGLTTSLGQLSVQGLDGNVLQAQVTKVVRALPELGGNASMIDLSAAALAQQAPNLNAVDQIWTNLPSDARLLAALSALKVKVLGDRAPASVIRAFGGTSLALADDFFVVCAMIGLILVLGMTLFAIVNRVRGRSVESADLISVGIGRRIIRRTFLIEQMVVVVLGLGVGTLAAVVATDVALPSVPEFASLPPGPALTYGISTALVLAVMVTELVLLGAFSTIGARLTVARAAPELLRVAPQ